MAEDAVERQNGIPVPKEGSAEWLELNKMAKVAVPVVLVIFTLGVLMQQAFGMIYINIGDQLGQPNLAPLITSIPGIALGIVCVIYGSLGDFLSLKKMIVIGTLVFVAGSVLGLFGNLSIWIVIMARLVQSVGWQVSGSIFLVLVSKYIAKKDRVIPTRSFLSCQVDYYFSLSSIVQMLTRFQSGSENMSPTPLP